jgi:alpha-glucosidase
MTTTDLRTKDFEILVPVGSDGTAVGSLYLDDGVSLEQDTRMLIQFRYCDDVLSATGSYGYATDVKISKVTVLDENGSHEMPVTISMTQDFEVKIK